MKIHRIMWVRKLVSGLCAFSFFFTTTFPSFAQLIPNNNIVVDSAAHANSKAPTFDQSKGIDVLNIVAPTSGGVSHNKFTEFNVNEQGLIVNNLNMLNYNTDHKSVLSGEHVELNTNLGTGSAAKVILNEVTSNSTSELKGYTEIYGKRADYIVANPNGITCAGCGFINTARLSLITGSANMVDGNIRDFTISPVGIIRINGVGEANFGMNVSGSGADIISNMVKIAGKVYVDDELGIFTGNDKYDYYNRLVSSNNTGGVGVALDSTALGGMVAGNIKIFATQKGFGVNIAGDVVSDIGDIEITADGNIVHKAVAATGDANLTSKSGDIELASDGYIHAENAINLKTEKGDIVLNGEYAYGGIINLNSAKNIVNNTHAVSIDELYFSALGDITNKYKIASGSDSYYSAKNFHNYGQLLSNDNMNFDIGWDYINYRDSGVISAGDINFAVGRNIINYMAEIFALGDINLGGKEGVFAGLSEANKTVDATKKYDNPYIADQHAKDVVRENKQEINFDTVPEVVEVIITSSGSSLTFPPFAENAKAGSRKMVDGYEVIVGRESEDSEGNVSYVGNTELTIKRNGVRVAYHFPDDGEDDPTPTIIEHNTAENNSDTLNQYKAPTKYVSNLKMANALVNYGGRIESFSDININADKIINMGANFNTGKNAYDLDYKFVRKEAAIAKSEAKSAWQELGRYVIKNTYLDSEAGYIIAGGNLGIAGRNLLNQSSTLAAKNDVYINVQNLTNQTASEVVDLTVAMQRRYRRKVVILSTVVTENKTETYKERIYSKENALILAGNNLLIDAKTVKNDQVEAGHGRAEAFETGSSIIDGEIKIPTSSNGIFKKAREGSNYLIVSNADFMDANDFVGNDYFFGRLPTGHPSTKLLGDNAYETRMIMDAIRQATSGFYLPDSDVDSDYAQMKSLYDNALSQATSLGLKVGKALTSAQISALNNDIIWYVEKTVDGKKVLVPELYLSSTTKDAIRLGSVGDKMVGKNVGITADFVTNSGTIFASNFMSIKAKSIKNESNTMGPAEIYAGDGLKIETDTLTNLSGFLGSDGITQIIANNLLNETKVYRSETMVGDKKNGKYTLREWTGDTATIYGQAGLNIDVTEDFMSKGGVLESVFGDIALSAQNATFDAVQVHNRTEVYKTKKRSWGRKKKSTEINDSIVNVGSNVTAGGNFSLTTAGDATFVGSTVNVGGDLLFDIGNEFNAIAAVDSSYYEKSTMKRGFGGFSKKNKDVIKESTTLVGTAFNVGGNFTSVSGGNTKIVASDIFAGGDAKLFAGYTIGENGLEKNDSESTVNIINGYETARDYEKTVKKGFSLSLSGGCDGGCSVEVGIAKIKSNSKDITTTTAVSSNVGAAGNVVIGSSGDINVIGSNIRAEKALAFDAAKNVNILSAANTVEETSASKKSKVSLTASVGNAYVDAAMAADALYKAGKAVDAAKDRVNELEKLQKEGKASVAAVEDAKINLVAATANFANATIALASSIAGAAAAAASSPYGTGVYANVGVKIDGTEVKDESKAVTYLASNVSAGENVSFKAGENMTQIGSLVSSDNGSVIYDITKDLTFGASKNTSNYKQSTKSASVSSTWGTNGTSNNANASVGSNRSSSISYDNAQTLAENGQIVYNVGGDMRGVGYNALAQDIVGDIKGNMTLASLQNSYYSNHSSFGAGINWGSSESKDNAPRSNNHGANASASKGNSERAWTDDISSIIGTESVNLKVGGTLALEGAMIANAETIYEKDEEGNIIGVKEVVDKGNLKIAANNFIFTDLIDMERSSESGISMAHSNGSTEGQTKGAPKGSTTVGVTDTGYEKEGITRATIGSGEITYLDGSSVELASLNRDIGSIQSITKDMVTGALDASVTVDNRIFTSDGRALIVKDFKISASFIENVAKNIVEMAKGNVVEGVKNIRFQERVKNVIGDIASTEEGRALLAIITGQLEVSVEERDAALGAFAKTLAAKYNMEIGDVKSFAAILSEENNDKNQIAGALDRDKREDGSEKKNVYLNLTAIGKDVEHGLGIFGHEVGHGIFGRGEEMASLAGNHFANTVSDGMWISGLNSDFGQWSYGASDASYLFNNAQSFYAVQDMDKGLLLGAGAGAGIGFLIKGGGAAALGAGLLKAGEIALVTFAIGGATKLAIDNKEIIVDKVLAIADGVSGLFANTEDGKDGNSGESKENGEQNSNKGNPNDNDPFCAKHPELCDKLQKSGEVATGTGVASENDQVRDTAVNIAIKGKELVSNLSQNAKEVIQYIQNNNFTANLPNYARHAYENINGALPQGTYYTFDVAAKVVGSLRGTERIVVDIVTRTMYYTFDHYETFIRLVESGS